MVVQRQPEREAVSLVYGNREVCPEHSPGPLKKECQNANKHRKEGAGSALAVIFNCGAQWFDSPLRAPRAGVSAGSSLNGGGAEILS